MLEIPESKNISRQIENELIGKTIAEVINATSPHSFTWYEGDPLKYNEILVGREIEASKGHGAFVDIHCDQEANISISDGVNIRYHSPLEHQPKKHQLLIIFDDRSFISFTVSMYGSIRAYMGALENPYHQGSLNKISALDDSFDELYLESIFRSVTKNISIKALLATEQRIPGLGNGVLQDILFNSGIHPKRKILSISDFEKGELFHSIKTTLSDMTDKGGRDTEKDIYGKSGRYKSILSKNTYKEPCLNCGDTIVKEAYLGGSIYYCPTCQRI